MNSDTVNQNTSLISKEDALKLRKGWFNKADTIRTSLNRVMESDLSELVVGLMMMEVTNQSLQQDALNAAIFRMVKARAVGEQLNASPQVLALIAFGLSRGNPGCAVTYISFLKEYMLHHPYFSGEGYKLTLADVCQSIFPNGFFSQDDLSYIWDEQKTAKGNLLDMTLGIHV